MMKPGKAVWTDAALGRQALPFHQSAPALIGQMTPNFLDIVVDPVWCSLSGDPGLDSAMPCIDELVGSSPILIHHPVNELSLLFKHEHILQKLGCRPVRLPWPMLRF
jgi:hypothetical protein